MLTVSSPPETRDSLIRRLPNVSDVEAWELFVEIYEPLLFRLATGRGMQHADAEDFVQEVLVAVTKGIDGWVADPDRGPFRAWLFRIAMNLAVNFLTRRKHQRLGTGDSGVARLLEAQPAGDSSAEFLEEYRRELFRWAADRVRQQVSEPQWVAFWQTSVDNRPMADVARELNMSVGSVYIARCRVTRRIREMIQQHEEHTR